MVSHGSGFSHRPIVLKPSSNRIGLLRQGLYRLDDPCLDAPTKALKFPQASRQSIEFLFRQSIRSILSSPFFSLIFSVAALRTSAQNCIRHSSEQKSCHGRFTSNSFLYCRQRFIDLRVSSVMVTPNSFLEMRVCILIPSSNALLPQSGTL